MTARCSEGVPCMPPPPLSSSPSGPWGATSASPGVIHRAASAQVLLDSWHQGCRRIEQGENFFQQNPPGRAAIWSALTRKLSSTAWRELKSTHVPARDWVNEGTTGWRRLLSIRQLSLELCILEDHPRPFGKEKGLSALEGATLHPAVLLPSSITPWYSLTPRTKGGQLPFASLFLDLRRYHEPLPRCRKSYRPSRQQHTGPRLVPQERRGKMPFRGLGQRCHPISAGSPRGGRAFCVIRALIAQLRRHRKGPFNPLFL